MEQSIIEVTVKNLRKKGYEATCFLKAKDAVLYLEEKIQGKTVGLGDSLTMKEIGVYEALSKQNKVWDPLPTKDNGEFLDVARASMQTDIYLTSVNAIAETGELVNIDGTGNRVAGSLFGHEKVYFVIGSNKIEKDLQQAIHRARNVAAPKNSKKYNLKTPCVIKGDKCYDCKSPERICNMLAIHLHKMNDIDMEVVIIEGEYGY